MKKVFYITALLILVLVIFLLKNNGSNDNDFEILVGNLDTPWSIDFLPDGRMIFTERPGSVSVFDGKETVLVGTIEVSELSESGLLGIAVDLDFENNKFVYLYYTHDKGNRVSRFTLNTVLEDELILLDNIPNAQFHDGGRIKFGPDGLLYITTGDATVPSSAQNIESLSGKILRMNKDGSILQDNPFGNYVYSYGHRNPQGLAWNDDGELFSSEHGPTRNDEINLIVKGGNYGWPQECDEDSSQYINPLRCFTEFTLAPAGIAFYDNNLYVAGLRASQLRKISLANNTVISEEEMINNLGRIRDVVEHNGFLYIATSNRDGRGIPRIKDDLIIRIEIE